MRCGLVLTALIAIALSQLACSGVTSPSADPASADLLFVPADAITTLPLNIHEHGEGAVGFASSEDAHAQAWPALLIEHLASRGGWRQRESQWLNPTSPTSFRSGWQSGGCGCVLPDDSDERAEVLAHPTRSSGWTGEWEDLFGNIVKYSLTMAINDRWSGPRGNGYAEYTTAATVRDSRRRGITR